MSEIFEKELSEFAVFSLSSRRSTKDPKDPQDPKDPISILRELCGQNYSETSRETKSNSILRLVTWVWFWGYELIDLDLLDPFSSIFIQPGGSKRSTKRSKLSTWWNRKIHIWILQRPCQNWNPAASPGTGGVHRFPYRVRVGASVRWSLIGFFSA